MIHADIKQHRHFSIQSFSGLQLKTRQLKHIEIFRLLQQQIQAGFALALSRLPPSPYFFPAASRIAASISTTVLFPLEPVTATTGDATSLEKRSISPEIGMPAALALINSGVFKLTPGLTIMREEKETRFP